MYTISLHVYSYMFMSNGYMDIEWTAMAARWRFSNDDDAT